MSLEEVIRLAQSRDGQQLLANNAVLHSIYLQLTPLEQFNIIDLPLYGVDIPPIGYDDSIGECARYMDRLVLLQLPSNGFTYIIKAMVYYPMKSGNNPNPKIEVIFLDDSNNEISFPFNLISPTIQLTARIVFRPHFDGYLNNQWIFLQFEGYLHMNSISSMSISFACGLQIQGFGVVPDKIPKVLSVEARAFVSNDMRRVFDSPCNTYYTIDMEGATVQPPPHFRIAIGAIKCKDIDKSSHEEYIDAILANKFTEYFQAIKDSFARNTQNCSTSSTKYLDWLDRCIWMEETHMLLDISQHDMYYKKLDVDTSKDKSRDVLICRLKVNGSNENRPRISLGDAVRIRPVEEDTIILGIAPYELQGVVQNYNLSSETATCVFKSPNPHFKKSIKSGIRFHVRFTFERCGLRFIDEAISIVQSNPALKSRLFPSTTADAACASAVSLVDTNDHSLMESTLNVRQAGAVHQLLHRVSNAPVNSLPYIIFGPPGTGKTLVIISAIREIMRYFPEKTILATAPSDAAADVILMRLAEFFSPDVLFRLNWWQRSIPSVPIKSLVYCKQSADLFEVPMFSELSKFRIVVTTCGVAGTLRHLANTEKKCPIASLLFDVVFIDEAAQATEGESLVALSLCKPTGTMVIAGDTQQLGPSYRSPAFNDRDLYVSLEERLLDSPQYSFLREMLRANETPTIESIIDSFSSGARLSALSDTSLGSFLSQNYRSHYRIFELSSKLFYSNSLEQCGNEEDLCSLMSWDKLPSDSQFPVLVLGIDGEQKHTMDSPSFYNTNEANSVVQECQSLMSSQNFKTAVKQTDIGVIAAFRAQVLHIRTLLRTNNMREISVGSVEDFQGQEKRIIIISTVLSEFPILAEGEHIGLFGDYRRFNVAITRAMSLVVVIGHPRTMYHDKWFGRLLQFTDKNGAYKGYESLESVKHMAQQRRYTALGEGVARNPFSDNIEWRVML